MYLLPGWFVSIFMEPTDNICLLAPAIIRLDALSFVLLPVNVSSAFYFQSMMKPKISIVITISRGIVVSGILIYVLPLFLRAKGLWIAMDITEIVVCVYVFFEIRKVKRRMINNLV